jgi:predicted metalloprotease with PDZ domain
LKIKPAEKGKAIKLSLGIKSIENNGLAELTLVEEGGAAWYAGLDVGDSLVAIDGLQVKQDNLDSILENLIVDSEFQLSYFHQGELKQTTIVPLLAPAEKIEIEPLENASKEQKRHFNSWTKQDFNKSFDQ